MNATQQLHELGQSLWFDNITHALDGWVSLEVSPLLAFGDHGQGKGEMPINGGNA